MLFHPTFKLCQPSGLHSVVVVVVVVLVVVISAIGFIGCDAFIT